MRPRIGFAAGLGMMLSLVASACAVTTTVVGPAVPGVAAPFPECQAEAFAFVGETSLAAIGLGEVVGQPEQNRAGTVWVTAGPVAWPGPNGGMEMSPGRVLCVEWPDGSGMSTTIDDAWQPPGVQVSQVAEPAWPIIGIVVAAVVLAIGSAIAFRRT